MEKMYEFLKQYILYLMSINDYEDIDAYIFFFSSCISVEESIVLRERILKEESISTIRNNGVMAGFIMMLCCMRDRTL